MNEQRNLLIAIVLSVLILFGFQWLFPKAPAPVPATDTTASSTPPVPTGSTAPTAPVKAPTVEEVRASALDASRRIPVRTPRLHGSIAVTGARLDDLTLVEHHETPDPASPEIVLLSPVGSAHPYYAEFGWVPADGSAKVPGADTVWTAAPATTDLAPGGRVVLTWDNGDGL